MRLARRSVMPRLPGNLQELASLFDNGHLQRFNCCDITIFRSCIRDLDGKTSLIFACPVLSQSFCGTGIEELHVDATFKVVPVNMGYQLLSVHAMIQNYSIPIIFALMESKSRNSYDSVFRYVKDNLLANISPKIIISDYESTLRDVLQSYFPEARTSGCWFHHNQAVFKNMKSKGYYRLVNTNQFALQSLNLLFGLPLLPYQDIERAFQLIKMYAINHGVAMHNLFDYYERYWLRRVGTQIISVHGLPRRTNNNIESFHNKLRLKFSVTHPNLWIFLSNLSNLFNNYHVIMRQLENNLQPTRSLKAKYLLQSKRLKNATSQYDAGIISMWQFMQLTSYTTSRYISRHINWINEVDPNSEPEVEAAAVVQPIQEPQLPIAPQVSTCIVCLNARAANIQQHIVIPCGHAWVCNNCITSLPAPTRCPLCRMEEVTFQRIFLN
ncbi:uncharacterized protein LOC132944972 [Metopolophium dirhodum]|uniref:uncharacterized protein LOC132944972 n=1 Tax=Metopolophium dirhodum TaxID=44670 RepID=UPI0029905A9D|nr:uncharacterized protein LOC132944972 [Metopolophium dirhodum]XP_060870535.1 uncharacterized protein LOC132944972 [Metopolophium dirhodum]